VCRHPDREDLDRTLVLKRGTQADVARLVGVDRSTVSRHVSNHVMPALAQGVLMDTKDVAIGNIVEAFDRIHAELWVLYERATLSGDLRLAASLLDQLRRVLEVVVRQASKMNQATLEDIIARDPAADFAHYEGIRKSLVERLDDLDARHKRGIVRPDAADTGDGPDGGQSAGERGGWG
jgi:hypothetical protein